MQPLPAVRHGRVLVEPEEVLRSRLALGHRELLVRWKGAPATETSWVSLVEFQQLFPKFQLEDELLVQGGRDVMVGLQYKRRNKSGLKEA